MISRHFQRKCENRIGSYAKFITLTGWCFHPHLVSSISFVVTGLVWSFLKFDHYHDQVDWGSSQTHSSYFSSPTFKVMERREICAAGVETIRGLTSWWLQSDGPRTTDIIKCNVSFYRSALEPNTQTRFNLIWFCLSGTNRTQLEWTNEALTDEWCEGGKVIRLLTEVPLSLICVT